MRVLVTIKATSEADARSIAQKLPGFTPDPTFTPITFGNDEWIVAGTLNGPPPKTAISVEPETGVQLPDPDSEIQ